TSNSPISGNLEVTLPSETVINFMSPKDAAKELDDFDADDVAKLLEKLENKTHASMILTYFDPSYAKDVLAEMAPSNAAELLNMMDIDSAADILLEMAADNSEILELMILGDFENFVNVVEAAIKKADGLGDTERLEALQKLAEAVSALDTSTIVELLIAIAQLPETPSTVALLLESTSLSSTLNILSEWLVNVNYEYSLTDLANVFTHIQTETLSLIYRGLTGSERLILLEILPVQVTSRLPEIGEFEVSTLWIVPESIEPGDTLEIFYQLENVGDETDDYVVQVKINGETTFTDQGALEPGDSLTMSHTLVQDTFGTYTVEVLGITADFEVVELVIPEPPEPANIIVNSVEITPTQIAQGAEIQIVVEVENTGEEAGTEDIELFIDQTLLETKEIFLAGSDVTTLLFTMIADFDEGVHEISVSEKTTSFEIIIEKGQIPWTAIITILVVIAVIVYYLISQGYIDLKKYTSNN
ncbi:magnesium transporter MgtE N-terminal domain-containing protein, partial [Thermoproteota archaeon]